MPTRRSRISRPDPTDSLAGAERYSARPERHRAERLQQLLIELAAHPFHQRERARMGERQPVRAFLNESRIDIHDRGQANDIADLIAGETVRISTAVKEFMVVQDHV